MILTFSQSSQTGYGRSLLKMTSRRKSRRVLHRKPSCRRKFSQAKLIRNLSQVTGVERVSKTIIISQINSNKTHCKLKKIIIPSPKTQIIWISMQEALCSNQVSRRLNSHHRMRVQKQRVCTTISKSLSIPWWTLYKTRQHSSAQVKARLGRRSDLQSASPFPHFQMSKTILHPHQRQQQLQLSNLNYNKRQRSNRVIWRFNRM